MVSLQICLIAAALAGRGDATLLAFTSESCGPCRLMQPILQRLQDGGYSIRPVDVDREPELARQFAVRPIPCFVLIRNGREVDRVVGAASYDRLAQMWTPAATAPLSPQLAAPQTGRSGTRAQSPDDGSVPATQPPPALATLPPAAATVNDPRLAELAAHTTTAPVGASIRQCALEATVHLRVSDATGQSCGTGTIIDTHGEEALVVTCGHIFRASQGKGNIMVEMFLAGGTQPVSGRLLAYEADNRDVGLVAFRPGVAVRPMPVASTDYRPQRGEPVFSVGCDHGAPPTIRESQISAIDRYVGPPNLEILGHPVEGRSGGGLFSADGRLIGVCNAADLQEDRGIFAGVPTVHYQLKSINQERIYLSQQTPSPLAPIAPLEGPAVVPLQSISQNTPAEPFDATAEMICILRFRDPTSANDRLLVIRQPSPALMQLIAQESRAASGGADPQSLPPAAAEVTTVPRSASTGPIVRAQNR
jgi:thiol-disulfide isomerase/thioredoxin